MALRWSHDSHRKTGPWRYRGATLYLGRYTTRSSSAIGALAPHERHGPPQALPVAPHAGPAPSPRAGPTVRGRGARSGASAERDGSETVRRRRPAYQVLGGDRRGSWLVRRRAAHTASAQAAGRTSHVSQGRSAGWSISNGSPAPRPVRTSAPLSTPTRGWPGTLRVETLAHRAEDCR